MTNVDKPEYHTTLPAAVRFDRELSPYARLLYGDIYVLAQKHGYCLVGNQELAVYYEVSKKTISKWIADLINHGYIRREVIRDSNNQIVERKLYIEDLPINPLMDTPINPLMDTPINSLVDTPINSLVDTPINSLVDTPKSNEQANIRQKAKDNNTNISNDTVVELDPKEKKERIPYKRIIDYLNNRTGKKFSSKAKANQKLIQARWNEGYRYDDFVKVIDNMIANWKGKKFSDGKSAERYWQPSTLFGNKFDQYLNQAPNDAIEPDQWDYREDIGGYDDVKTNKHTTDNHNRAVFNGLTKGGF